MWVLIDAEIGLRSHPHQGPRTLWGATPTEANSTLSALYPPMGAGSLCHVITSALGGCHAPGVTARGGISMSGDDSTPTLGGLSSGDSRSMWSQTLPNRPQGLFGSPPDATGHPWGGRGSQSEIGGP